VGLDRSEGGRHVLLEHPTVGWIEIGDGGNLSALPRIEGVVVAGHDDVSGADGHGGVLLGVGGGRDGIVVEGGQVGQPPVVSSLARRSMARIELINVCKTLGDRGGAPGYEVILNAAPQGPLT